MKYYLRTLALFVSTSAMLYPLTGYSEPTLDNPVEILTPHDPNNPPKIPATIPMSEDDVIIRIDGASILCWLASAPEIQGQVVCWLKPKGAVVETNFLDDLTESKKKQLHLINGTSEEFRL